MKSDISPEYQEIIDTDKEKLAQALDLKKLEQEGIITSEGDWYRINNFNSLPQSAGNQIARLEQDSEGIKVQFLGQEELEAIIQEMHIPDETE